MKIYTQFHKMRLYRSKILPQLHIVSKSTTQHTDHMTLYLTVTTLIYKRLILLCYKVVWLLPGYFHFNNKKSTQRVHTSTKTPPMHPLILFIIIIIIMYLYSAQYLHIQQDSKRYLTNPTLQVQPQLTSN